MYVNIWIALSQQGLDEFKDKRDNENYSGPMDDKTFKHLSKMADLDTVQRMFKTPSLGGKVYTLFSVNINGTVTVQNVIDNLAAKWPNHFIVVGAWQMDGRQVGTQWNEDRTDTTGVPMYPIHAQAWRLMPDWVGATSNSELEDINVIVGQEPRRFS